MYVHVCMYVHVTALPPTSTSQKGKGWAVDIQDQLLDTNSVPAAMQLLSDNYPEKFLLKGTMIEQNLLKMHEFTNKTSVRYDLQAFDMKELDLTGDQVFLITGPSGCGKTGFAKAHFKNPLVISTWEDLKAFKQGFHDGLVFDDMTFQHLTPEQTIHLCDKEEARGFGKESGCRFTNATIPAGTQRIFTSNRDSLWSVFTQPQLVQHMEALQRRITHVKITKDIRRRAEDEGPVKKKQKKLSDYFK